MATIDHRQFRAARAVLELRVHDVAALTRMSNATVIKAERPGGPAAMNAATVHALSMFYQSRGLAFIGSMTGRGVSWREARLDRLAGGALPQCAYCGAYGEPEADARCPHCGKPMRDPAMVAALAGDAQ